MSVRAMTVRAVDVPCVRAHERLLLRVTCPAERCLVHRLRKVVWRMARGARGAAAVGRRVCRRDALVAARTIGRHFARIAMRRVARRARGSSRDGAQRRHGRMRRVNRAVAADARGRRSGGRVRRVAAQTFCVGGDGHRRERRLDAVAPGARLLGGDEVVRLVTRQARVVVRGLGPRWRRVTPRARGRRLRRRCVARVAVEASLAVGVIGVRGRQLRVTAGAVLRRDRGLAMGSVAIGARRRCVNTGDRRLRSLRIRMAGDARRRRRRSGSRAAGGAS